MMFMISSQCFGKRYRVPRKFQKLGTAGYRVPKKFHRVNGQIKNFWVTMCKGIAFIRTTFFTNGKINNYLLLLNTRKNRIESFKIK